jgi:hypothetical protein
MLNLLRESLYQFIERERENIMSDVSERNLCCRLAMVLEETAKKMNLNGYYADGEYNRKQKGEIKTIIDDQNNIIKITCDLILHSRGEIEKRDNLIAIEMKKSGREKNEGDKDRNRLRAMTKSSIEGVDSDDETPNPEHVCGYELGAFIEIDIEHCRINIELFVKGNFIYKCIYNLNSNEAADNQ